MDNLRLILILIGLVILALIWFFHQPRGSRRPGAVRRDQPRAEPGLNKPGARPDRPIQGDEDKRDDAIGEPEQTMLPSLNEDQAALQPVADAGPDGRREPVWNDAQHLDREEALPEPDIWPQDHVDADESSESGSSSPHTPQVVTLYVRARQGRRISGVSLLDAAIKAGLRFGDMNIFHRTHRGSDDPVFSMANLTSPGSFDPSTWNLFETPGVTLFMMLPGPLSALDAWDAMLATGQRLSELLEADLLDDAQCKVTRQRLSQLREEMREFDRKHDWS